MTHQNETSEVDVFTVEGDSMLFAVEPVDFAKSKKKVVDAVSAVATNNNSLTADEYSGLMEMGYSHLKADYYICLAALRDLCKGNKYKVEEDLRNIDHILYLMSLDADSLNKYAQHARSPTITVCAPGELFNGATNLLYELFPDRYKDRDRRLVSVVAKNIDVLTSLISHLTGGKYFYIDENTRKPVLRQGPKNKEVKTPLLAPGFIQSMKVTPFTVVKAGGANRSITWTSAKDVFSVATPQPFTMLLPYAALRASSNSMISGTTRPKTVQNCFIGAPFTSCSANLVITDQKYMLTLLAKPIAAFAGNNSEWTCNLGEESGKSVFTPPSDWKYVERVSRNTTVINIGSTNAIKSGATVYVGVGFPTVDASGWNMYGLTGTVVSLATSYAPGSPEFFKSMFQRGMERGLFMLAGAYRDLLTEAHDKMMLNLKSSLSKTATYWNDGPGALHTDNDVLLLAPSVTAPPVPQKETITLEKYKMHLASLFDATSFEGDLKGVSFSHQLSGACVNCPCSNGVQNPAYKHPDDAVVYAIQHEPPNETLFTNEELGVRKPQWYAQVVIEG